MKNPITKADQVYFTHDDEAACRARYLTLKLMTEIYGAPWQKLVRQLRDAGVVPVGGEARPFGNLYLRSEANRVLS